jgi:transcription factor TFIIIB component B''
MSSIIKKKGALSFKPKAPQTRRQPGGPPSTNSSTRQSIDRQSQTPAPVPRVPVSSPPPEFGQLQRPDDGLSRPRDPTDIPNATQSQVPESTHQNNVLANPCHTTQETPTEEVCDAVEDAPPRPTTLEQTEPIVEDGARREDTQILSATPEIPHLPHTSVTETINRDDAGVAEAEPLRLQVIPVSRGADLSTLGAGESIRPSQLIPIAQLNPDGTSTITIPQPKRPSKRRRLDKDTVDIRPTIEVQLHRGGVPGLRKPRKRRDKSAKRKKREETPEDAEEQEIDHTIIKMSDLTRDLRIGRKFSKHDEIKQRQLQKRKKAKLAREHPELMPGDGDEHGSPLPTVVREVPLEASAGPRMRIVNGQIVIDDRSLVVDRHKRAAATAPIMEEVEENELSHITTSGTYMKREKNLYWSNDDNEKFYNALRMLGTDFEMISKMFPERNRRQIKLKFNKEEREFPEKISNALNGEKVGINLEEYKSHTGLEYEEVAAIEAERERIEEEHNAEQQKMQAQADETTRQKKAAIQSTADSGANMDPRTGGAESAKENDVEGGRATATSRPRKKAAAKKKKKNIHSSRGGGEEVEVLGTIDDVQS